MIALHHATPGESHNARWCGWGKVPTWGQSCKRGGREWLRTVIDPRWWPCVTDL